MLVIGMDFYMHYRNDPAQLPIHEELPTDVSFLMLNSTVKFVINYVIEVLFTALHFIDSFYLYVQQFCFK